MVNSLSDYYPFELVKYTWEDMTKLKEATVLDMLKDKGISYSYLAYKLLHNDNSTMLRTESVKPTSMVSMRYYTTFVLCLAAFFIFADQNVLAPNLSAVAADFGFSSEEKDRKLGGDIALGFFVVGGPLALLLGYLADIMNRTILFSVVVILGEGASLCVYWIKTYEQLFICRVLTGISVGGAAPIIFSLLGDLYPSNSRVYVATIFGTSAACGTASGQLISGLVGPSLGWRAPFLMVAAPAILCGLMVLFTIDEPTRGHQEKAVRKLRDNQSNSIQPTTANPIIDVELNSSADEESHNKISPAKSPDEFTMINPVLFENGNAATLSEGEFVEENGDPSIKYDEKIEWRKVAKLMRTPSALIIFCQGLPGCLPWGMISVFLNDYFSEDRGMTVQAATAVITTFSAGGLLGQLFGGWFGQRLYNKDPRLQCVLMGISTMLSVPPVIYLINSKVVGDPGFYFMAALGGFLISMNGPNVKVVLQNVCTPEIRGTAFAIFNLTDDVGKGLGPELVVFLISGFQGNRRHAFTIVTIFWIICGTLILSLIFFVQRDEERVNNSVEDSLLKMVSNKIRDEDPSDRFTPRKKCVGSRFDYFQNPDQSFSPPRLRPQSLTEYNSCGTSHFSLNSEKKEILVDYGFTRDAMNPLILNETYHINLNTTLTNPQPSQYHKITESSNNTNERSLVGERISHQHLDINIDINSQH